MVAEDIALEAPVEEAPLRAKPWLPERLLLEAVDLGDAAGFVIPSNPDRSATYRGRGELDYACGNCGALLCIGVRRGLFRSLLFSCACGVLNRVP
jgi:hypothetical protein